MFNYHSSLFSSAKCCSYLLGIFEVIVCFRDNREAQAKKFYWRQ